MPKAHYPFLPANSVVKIALRCLPHHVLSPADRALAFLPSRTCSPRHRRTRGNGTVELALQSLITLETVA